MDLQLSGKNAVVIGGSRGIGRAIALGLAEEGANVAICARNEEALRDAESEIGGKGVRTLAVPCDAGDPPALARFLDATSNSSGVASGFLIGGTQNHYSFFASADWELIVPDYNYGFGVPTTLIVQLDVSGNEVLVGPSTPTKPLAPNTVNWSALG